MSLQNNDLIEKSKVYRLVNNICCVLLLVQICVISIVVFGRFVLNKTPGWGEELSLICMIYFSLLSVSLAVEDSRHLKITLTEMYMPRKFNEFIRVFNYVIIGIVSIFMVVVGADLTFFVRKGSTPGMHISIAFIYASVPCAGLAILVLLIRKALRKEAL